MLNRCTGSNSYRGFESRPLRMSLIRDWRSDSNGAFFCAHVPQGGIRTRAGPQATPRGFDAAGARAAESRLFRCKLTPWCRRRVRLTSLAVWGRFPPSRRRRPRLAGSTPQATPRGFDAAGARAAESGLFRCEPTLMSYKVPACRAPCHPRRVRPARRAAGHAPRFDAAGVAKGIPPSLYESHFELRAHFRRDFRFALMCPRPGSRPRGVGIPQSSACWGWAHPIQSCG